MPEMTQSINVGLEERHRMAPPYATALLPEMVQEINVGLLPDLQETAPPLAQAALLAWLFTKTQFRIVGLLPAQ